MRKTNGVEVRSAVKAGGGGWHPNHCQSGMAVRSTVKAGGGGWYSTNHSPTAIAVR
jgi:hypothetical protein